VFLGELAQGDEFLSSQTVLLRNQEDNLIVEKRLREQIAAGGRIEAQDKINISRAERVEGPARDFGHNPEVDVFMGTLEGANNRGKPVIAGAAVRTKPNGFRMAGTATQAFLRVVNHLKGPARRFH
jgi:hypothetical protein